MNNMFSQELKEEVVEDLFDSMKQLDRIEFQNKLIQQKQVLNSMKIGECTLLISAFISMLFFTNYTYTYLYLSSLGIYSYFHLSALGNTFMVFFLLLVVSLISFLIRLYKIEKFKKENDEELDFILGKK